MSEGLTASLYNQSLYISDVFNLTFRILQKDILKTSILFPFLIKISIAIKELLKVCFVVHCYWY